MTKCRHPNTSLLSTNHEWCWRCGALRFMRLVESGVVTPDSRWTRPAGRNGENPFPLKPLKRGAEKP